MRYHLRLMSFVGAVVLGLFLGTSQAQAFEIQPAITELSLQAGSSTQREILVKNTENETKAFFLTVQKFIAGGNGQPSFLDPADTVGLPSWLRVSDPVFTLAAGEQKAIQVVIDVPREAPSGGSYAAVFVTEKKTESSSPVGFSKRIGSLFLVSVDQEKAPADLQLKSLRTLYNGATDWKKWFSLHGQGETRIRLSNEGRSHGTAAVEIRRTVWSLTGKRVEVSQAVVRLLPKEEREIVESWEKKSPIILQKTDVLLQGKVVEVGEMKVLVLPSFGVYSVFAVGVFIGVVFLVHRRKSRKVVLH